MVTHTTWSEVKKVEVPRRKAALAKTEERRKSVIDATNAFLGRTGMSKMELARRIGYGYSTLNKFLANRYYEVGSNDGLISDALLRLFATLPVDGGVQTTDRVYEIAPVRQMRGIFQRCLERAHIFMVYGPPGRGKTEAVRHLIAEHNRQHAAAPAKGSVYQVYCRAAIRPLSLVRRIAIACSAGVSHDTDSTLANILWLFRGRRVAIVFDEAQHLDVDCMETVRELFDIAQVSLIFTGSHELERIFRRFEGTLEQLERRVTDKITLDPVTRDEAVGIVRSELEELVPDLDEARVAQLIEMATVSVRVGSRRENYISIGRLMATIREARESLDGDPAPQTAEVTQ